MKQRSFQFGFTLIETLVAVGIIAVLGYLLFPALQKAQESSRRTGCANSIRLLAIPANAYQVEHRGYLPPGLKDKGVEIEGTYLTYFEPYIQPGATFLCPIAKKPIEGDAVMGTKDRAWKHTPTGRSMVYGSYGMCYSLRGTLGGAPVSSTETFQTPIYELPVTAPRNETPMFVDCIWPGFTPEKNNGWNSIDRVPLDRHGGGASVLFADGSARFLNSEGLARLKWSASYNPAPRP